MWAKKVKDKAGFRLELKNQSFSKGRKAKLLLESCG